MKKGIHPQYHQDVQITDIDGNNFTVSGATVKSLKVDVSYVNHPAYNKGMKKEIKVRGRFQAFQEKAAKIAAAQEATTAKKPAVKKEKETVAKKTAKKED